MNQPIAVNTGSQTPYGIKHGNLELGVAEIDYRYNDSGLTWYNSVDYANKYVIYTSNNDLGIGTNVPIFWSCDENEIDLLRIINGLPGRRGEVDFNTVDEGITWVNASETYFFLLNPAVLVLSLDAGNVMSYPGSGTVWNDLISGKSFNLLNGPTYFQETKIRKNMCLLWQKNAMA